MTTAQSPVDPSSGAGRKRISGKYLAALENYVETLELEPDEFLAKTNPQFEVLKESMSRMFSPHLTSDEAQAIVFKQCMRVQVDAEDRRGSLAVPENRDLRDQLVERLKSYFESLPRTCTLRIELPGFPELDGVLSDLAPDVRLISTPPLGTNKLLAFALQGGFPDGTVRSKASLEISTEGYGSASAHSRGAAECLSVAKQCAFVMTAFGLCDFKIFSQKSRATFSDGASEAFFNMEMPEAVGRLYSQLKVDESKLRVYQWQLEPDKRFPYSSLLDEGRTPTNSAEKALALDHLFLDVRRFFRCRSNEDFEQIAAAIEWYQDSKWADNDTFAYIAACVGLEAVIGSKDEQLDTLSKRLGDRYAFLIGKGRRDREALRAQYNEVLKLRGQLVHGKAARLAPEQRPLLRTAQDMLLNVIWKELLRIRAEDA